METVELLIPKKSEYLSSARLASSSLSNMKGFNIDEIEDIKVILSEACIFFIKNIESDSKPLKIIFYMDRSDFIINVIDTNDECMADEYKSESEMSVLIIESLSDSYNIDLEHKEISIVKKIY